MQVKLSMIKSSAQPVRTSRDEQKMKELMQSIKQYGLLQAVKLRPAGDKYEVVFGHRRVEACRRLGLGVIEAVVKDVGDSTALIHGLIENVVREDLEPLDKARTLKALQDETGWNSEEMQRQGIMSARRILELLKLLEEPEVVQQMLAKASRTPRDPRKLDSITAYHVEQVRREKLPEEQHIQILQKAAEEGLTAQQARVEARILKTYGTEEEVKVRAQRYIEQEKQDKEKSRWNYLADSPCAKNFIRYVKVNTETLKRLWQDVEQGALGVEHMPYVEERLRKHAEFIISLADELEERRKKAVDE